MLAVGEIVGAFGVRGWVKVQSFTDPPENILNYSPWTIGELSAGREYVVVDGSRHGNAVVARLEGVPDRDAAARLQKSAIAVPRSRLPPLPPGQYYWADLIGLEVRTPAGAVLGTVVNMMATGANDVMEVRGDRDRLIPFVTGEFVKEVRLDTGIVVVDWDPEF